MPTHPEKTIDVSIIVISYNSAEDIVNCIGTAIKHTKDCNTEVIVLDNRSTDDTVEVIHKELPDIRLIESQENLGFAKGVNTAIQQALGKYILLLNPDTEIFNNAIGNIFTFAEKHPQYGLYGARTLKPDGTLQPVSCLGLPTLWSLFTFATGLSAIFKNNEFFDPESLGSWKRDSVREVGSIVGCFLLCRKEHWEKLEGFDVRFYMYGEDVDLAMRSKAMGYPSVICPDAELIHEFGKSADTPLHKLIMLYRGKITLAHKHWSGFSRLLAVTFIRCGILTRAMPSIIKSATTKGFSHSSYHQLWKKRGEWSDGYSLD